MIIVLSCGLNFSCKIFWIVLVNVLNWGRGSFSSSTNWISGSKPSFVEGSTLKILLQHSFYQTKTESITFECLVCKTIILGISIWNILESSQFSQQFRHGLVVRIAGSHPAGPGSIPGAGKLVLLESILSPLGLGFEFNLWISFWLFFQFFF